MPACYSGPLPVTDEERMAIWRWAKANGIDHGLPFEKIHDAINEHFFAGAAKPEWVTDILSGRKTPFRVQANAAWKTQYNRRMIVQHAKELTERQAMSPAGKAFRALWSAPRSAAVFAHGWVLPITHAGNLVNRAAKGSQSTRAWDILTTMRFQLWDKAMSKHVDPGMGHAEQLEIGKHLAEWANHATGSGKGVVSALGGKVLFGPKL